jgi:serine protease Do/serine protease DegQ
MGSLIETGTVTRGYLGVTTETVTADVAEQLGLPKDAKGVAITDISPDGPADQAGLKRSDVILMLNGKSVSSLEELRLAVAQMAPNSQAKVKLMRDGKEMTLDVTLGKLSEKPDELLAGVNAANLDEEQRQRSGLETRVNGLVITDVESTSPFADRLFPGMVIIEINRVPVVNLAMAKQSLVQGRNLLLVNFRGAYRFIAVTVK